MASLKPSDYDAKGLMDAAAFLIGAAAGGLVDATLNTFGFAEPFVVAPLTGAGMLGLKKAVWDAPIERRQRKKNAKQRLQRLRTEAELASLLGDNRRSQCIETTIGLGIERDLDIAEIEALVAKHCDGP